LVTNGGKQWWLGGGNTALKSRESWGGAGNMLEVYMAMNAASTTPYNDAMKSATDVRALGRANSTRPFFSLAS